jgi:hypothetical protein
MGEVSAGADVPLGLIPNGKRRRHEAVGMAIALHHHWTTLIAGISRALGARRAARDRDAMLVVIGDARALAVKGAMRLIMVSRPNDKEPARGLLLTLSNQDGTHFKAAVALLPRVHPSGLQDRGRCGASDEFDERRASVPYPSQRSLSYEHGHWRPVLGSGPPNLV